MNIVNIALKQCMSGTNICDVLLGALVICDLICRLKNCDNWLVIGNSIDQGLIGRHWCLHDRRYVVKASQTTSANECVLKVVYAYLVLSITDQIAQDAFI